MAYTPTVWKDGDVVTSARLNKIENAIEAITETPGSSSFDLSDRMAKGVDSNGNVVEGAVIEGILEDKEITDEYGTYTINKNKATGDYSHAEGVGTTASGALSHTEGNDTTASGGLSHAEGLQTTADGQASHAEGRNTTASGNSSHAEGGGATASGMNAHAEGGETTASGESSHAEGGGTTASKDYSHAEGSETTASGKGSHAEGIRTTASGMDSHAEGGETVASGTNAHAEGIRTTASGLTSHAEGNRTTASGDESHTEGSNTIANHASQHVFGEFNVADTSTAEAFERGTYVEIVGNGISDNSRSNARTLDWSGNEVLAGKLTVGVAPTNDMDVATKKYVDDNAGGSSFDLSDRIAKGVDTNGNTVEGAVIEGLLEDKEFTDEHDTYTMNKNKATGMYSHAEGAETTASGESSHAEGETTTASGQDSHAEGAGTTASDYASHAEGDNTIASGYVSHAEGDSTTASGNISHAEGDSTTASGDDSHAEGNGTTASGEASHAEGQNTTASGDASHAEGSGTTANHKSQHVFGEFNVADTSTTEASKRGTYVEIIGNGSNRNNRSNARTLDWNGNEVLAGKLTVGAAPTNDMDVATKKYVDDNAGGSGSSFDLSDRIAKGVDDNENTVKGAVIEGCIKDEEITDEQGTYTINKNKASGEYSHAEGFRTTASSNASHAEGGGTTASGIGSHAEGSGTTASGYTSHAEGENTIASGDDSHAEGVFAKASGMGSHAEGGNTTASGKYSHAEGGNTTASGMSSHAEGIGTIANGTALHVFGKYNIEPYAEDNPYVEIVGNGSDDDNRSNARTLDWQGNERLAGSLTLGNGTNDVITISAAQLKNLLTPMIVTIRTDSETGEITLNMTWQEIYDAFASGRRVLVQEETALGGIYLNVDSIGAYSDEGKNIYGLNVSTRTYTTSTPSGFPAPEN